jgi:hypothetical protein
VAGTVPADANTYAPLSGSNVGVSVGGFGTQLAFHTIPTAGLYLVSAGGFGPAQPSPSNAYRGMRLVRLSSGGALLETIAQVEQSQGSVYPALSASGFTMFSAGEIAALEMNVATAETWGNLEFQVVKLA